MEPCSAVIFYRKGMGRQAILSIPHLCYRRCTEKTKQGAKMDGWVKIRLHRPLPDGFTLKNILVTKKADGWYFTFAIEDPSVPVFNLDEIIPTWDNSLGMDAVLHEQDYLATSEGKKLPSVKSFRKNQSKLAKVSRQKALRKKGSARRKKLAKREGRIHQTIARSRRDHAYKTAHQLVRTEKKVFFHEKLNLAGLSKRNEAKKDDNGNFIKNGQASKSGLNKSWNDAEKWSILYYIGLHSLESWSKSSKGKSCLHVSIIGIS